MKRFKNILVVGSETPNFDRVMAEATSLARRNDAQLRLLGVVDSGRSDRRVVLYDGTELDIERIQSDSLRDELLAAAIEHDGVDIDVEVTTGRGFVEVIRAAVEYDHDLVVVGTEVAKRRLAGSSMAMHLLRKCPVPVWVENGNDDLGADVAVAVGPLDGSDDYSSLNRTLLELGSSLALIRGGTLHVIHAWRLVGESLLRRGRARPAPQEIDIMVEETKRLAEEELDRLLRPVADTGVRYEVHFEKGDAETVVPAVLDRVLPGVIVMGTLARAGLRGVLMGNTAEYVLANTTSSVLTVKPPGFTSPVEF